jgi:hypothetical protein
MAADQRIQLELESEVAGAELQLRISAVHGLGAIGAAAALLLNLDGFLHFSKLAAIGSPDIRVHEIALVHRRQLLQQITCADGQHVLGELLVIDAHRFLFTLNAALQCVGLDGLEEADVRTVIQRVRIIGIGVQTDFTVQCALSGVEAIEGKGNDVPVFDDLSSIIER